MSYQNFNFFTRHCWHRYDNDSNLNQLTGGGGYFKVAGAKNVVVYFSRGDTSDRATPSTLFRIQVTPMARTVRLQSTGNHYCASAWPCRNTRWYEHYRSRHLNQMYKIMIWLLRIAGIVVEVAAAIVLVQRVFLQGQALAQ